jgi:N-acetylglutamate synthase
MEKEIIRRIEELSANAWPGFETLLLDGWVARIADGYTRRANSVLPLYPGISEAEGRIAACEMFYRRRGLPVIFKMTEASQPEGLDDLLALRGYRAEAQTSVQLLDLNAWKGPERIESELRPAPGADWQAAFARMGGMKPAHQPTHTRILASIQPACCYAALLAGEGIAACGLAVLQDGAVGLFDILVDANMRRKGYGEIIVRDLLAWAQRQGAQTGYLQVMLNNPPALNLYAKMGYRPVYTYWYRVKE